MSNIVRAQGLTKQVEGPGGTLRILHEVDISVAAGEAVAIVGPSGSGKSTLLGLLAGLDESSSGEIHLFEQPLRQLNEDARAALRAGQVGFVFQSFQLLPSLTALENVILPLELVTGNVNKQVAIDILQQVGLGERLQHYPMQLSGGEQQRVALARAFVVKPKLLFADEPTGNLDHASGANIAELLFQLRQDQNTAVVLVTHDRNLAARCDRQYQMEAGQLSLA